MRDRAGKHFECVCKTRTYFSKSINETPFGRQDHNIYMEVVNHMLSNNIFHFKGQSYKLPPPPPPPPILCVGERNAKSLPHILMPSVLPPSLGVDTDVGIATAALPAVSCSMNTCRDAALNSHYQSSGTGENFTVRHRMSCDTANPVYLLDLWQALN